MDKVKFGVVGLKGIGRTHIEGITSTEEAELLAVADINEEEGRTVSSKYGAKWYRDYERMLELEELDAVTICTPHFLHYPMAMKALNHGKHVLVEKPMAITVREADNMIDNARKKGLKLGVVFQHRTNPVNQEIKRLIETGEIGPIYRVCMEVCGFRTQLYYDRDKWRGKWITEGGGALINQTIHHIDLLQWFAGKPAKLQGQISTMYHDVEVEDIASATILFKNGAHGVLQVSIIDTIRTTRFEICGEKGKILSEDEETKLAILEKDLKEYISEDAVWGTRPEFQWREIEPRSKTKGGHGAIIKDFAQAILEDREPLINGEDGRTSLEIVNAIILSSFEEKAVSFPIDRDAYENLMETLAKK